MPVYDPTIWEGEAAQEFLQAIMSLDNKSAAEAFLADIPVSYTHLTLPTSDLV